MASIYKPKGSNKYRIAYKDHNGKRKTTWGYRDKQATQARAREIETKAERKHAGMRTTEKKGILDAVEAYLSNLVRSGSLVNSPHYKESDRILQTIINHCAWHTTRDANNADFLNYLNSILPDAAPRTRNRHQETLRAFLNFCCRLDWLDENPIARLKMAPVGQAGRRHHRRAFTEQEFKWLMAYTPEPRRTVYIVAGLSGLRRSELAKLTHNDYLDNTARWTLRPEITKNKKAANLPMLAECLDAIAKHRHSTPGWIFASNVFKSIPHVWTLRADMKRAGISRVDSRDGVLDFHSFRYFFCTLLAKHLPIQTVAKLMRHSDIRLTANLYNDLGLQDLTEKVESLPRLLGQSPSTKETPIRSDGASPDSSKIRNS